MSGYTKGPWEWWTSNSFLRLSSGATGKDGGVIDSYVMNDGHSSLSVKHDDMALIAAAPELLEALQVCAGYLGELDHSSAIYTALMDKVNDAIEKALGQ
ncbi:hypothetical protein [Pantoea sp.]|uniref:hypothetical protein n=1 Tax=Pantoea sp. TaxID=69393 RepID=UPI0028AD8CD8|nr:hypothetical protein [Pantoea sp.]